MWTVTGAVRFSRGITQPPLNLPAHPSVGEDMRYLAVLLLFLLPSCATWVHPTKTEADFDRDGYECEVDAAPLRDGWGRVAMWQRCMHVKGWRQQ